MRLTFFSTQLALLRGRSTSAAPPRREKTTAQRICVGASCLLYWLLCGALCDVSRPTAALYFLVGLASTNADTGLLVVCPPFHGERLVDRWLATAGTVRVLVAVGQIGLAGPAHHLNFLFMLCLVVLAFRLLHLSRGVPRAPDQTWRWVRLHATWHLISVLGGAHALRSEAALLLPEGNVGEGGDPAGMAAAAAAAGAALRAFRGATTSPAGLVALGCVGAYLIYAWNRRAIFAAIWKRVSGDVDTGLRVQKRALFGMGGSTEGAATKGGGVEGVVLEIGAGVGANFVYYDRDRVTALVANEPNAGMHQTLRRAAAEAGWVCDDDDDNGDNDDNGAPHDASHEGGGGAKGGGRNAAPTGFSIDTGSAHSLAFPDDTFDVCVCTLVLCSVPDPAAVLDEVLRVLRPGGRFLFLEHIAAPRGTALRAKQDRYSPLWMCLPLDGCRINAETDRLMQGLGGGRGGGGVGARVGDTRDTRDEGEERDDEGERRNSGVGVGVGDTDRGGGAADGGWESVETEDLHFFNDDSGPDIAAPTVMGCAKKQMRGGGGAGGGGSRKRAVGAARDAADAEDAAGEGGTAERRRSPRLRGRPRVVGNDCTGAGDG
jgi:SAM-dependent methyltransferase